MMLMEEMTWTQIEVGLEKSRTVILPVGATEEHGPHLPTFTDTIQALEVAKEVARRRPIFVAPPVHYGVCRSTRGFPGTISISPQALRTLVFDLLCAFRDSGFERVLVLTGHAGGQHLAALKEAAERAVASRDLRVSLVSDFDLIDSSEVETPGDGHAGEIETSRMLVIREDLVGGLPEKHFPSRPRYLVMKDVRHLMGNGIMGDPSKATKEKGKKFMEISVLGVLEAVEELESYPSP
ncbi:creatininase family protein [Methanocrinis sp.]|uniref:creatininase family protein n=1 Tax=Methanocrinis sp. TaxID=3101522 RepID=UPI003D0E3E73